MLLASHPNLDEVFFLVLDIYKAYGMLIANIIMRIVKINGLKSSYLTITIDILLGDSQCTNYTLRD